MTKRTVFITGGASGIGFGIAQAMSKAGHHVIIADINEQAAQSAANARGERIHPASAPGLRSIHIVLSPIHIYNVIHTHNHTYNVIHTMS